MSRHDHIAIREYGCEQGPPVVLLHGFPGNAADFGPTVEQLSRHHRVLVPDLLGFGASDTPEGSLWIDRQATAIDRALAERGVRSAVLVGHDVGGPVAAWLASEWGQRARGLVVASCSLVSDPPIPPPFRLLRVPLLGRIVEACLFSGAALRALARFASRGPTPARNSPAEVRSIRRMFATALRDLPGHYRELEGRLRAITAPTVFVVGDRDPFFTGRFARRMADLLPGQRLVTIPGAGHFPQLERPTEFSAVVLSLATAGAGS